MSAREAEFREYVQTRLPALRRSAYLLCGDNAQADDLISIALGKLYRAWPRVRRLEQPDSYVRRMLVNAHLDERRRPWRREHSVDQLPEPPPRPEPDVVERLSVAQLLGRLPARRRAVLVLRFLDDLSVEETAATLGCTPGTVKTQTSRGLADLRELLRTHGYETADLNHDKDSTW